jgi:hypothetical protein
MWENSPLVLKQLGTPENNQWYLILTKNLLLDKIGPVLAGNLVSKGITSFEKLAVTDPRRIEVVCS